MKLGPETKLDKRNKAMSKKFDGNVMSENYDTIAIFPVCGQFGAILTFYLTKIESRTKESLTQLLHYCFE